MSGGPVITMDGTSITIAPGNETPFKVAAGHKEERRNLMLGLGLIQLVAAIIDVIVFSIASGEAAHLNNPHFLTNIYDAYWCAPVFLACGAGAVASGIRGRREIAVVCLALSAASVAFDIAHMSLTIVGLDRAVTEHYQLLETCDPSDSSTYCGYRFRMDMVACRSIQILLTLVILITSVWILVLEVQKCKQAPMTISPGAEPAPAETQKSEDKRAPSSPPKFHKMPQETQSSLLD